MNATNQINSTATPLWVTAQSKHNVNRLQKAKNIVTKREYFRVLEAIKGLYKPLSERAFERNYITHPSDKSNPMHCFLNNEVYWHLSCDDCYSFTIHFNIADVMLRNEINCLIALMLKSTHLKAAVETDVSTMFKRCKRLQADEFFYNLK